MTRLGWIVTTLLVASGVLTGCSNEPWMTQEPIAPRVAVLRAPRWERPELAATPTVAATVPPHLAGWDVASADREWRYIVIHHSATEYGNAQTFDVHLGHVLGLVHLGGLVLAKGRSFGLGR